MTLSQKNCDLVDCSRVSGTVKVLGASPVSTNTFISSPALGSRVAVTDTFSCRLKKIQLSIKTVEYKNNKEHLQCVQYQLVLAVDCGRKPKLLPWHIFPHLGSQKGRASGDWTSFAVPIGCYRIACYNGVVL